MHPILTSRFRLALYLSLWIAFGCLLWVVLVFGGRAPMLWALEFAIPIALALGLQSLSFWYLVQALPPGQTAPMRMALIWTAAGVGSLLAWLAVAYGWAVFLLPSDDAVVSRSMCRRIGPSPAA